jgi:hypothetical protein
MLNIQGSPAAALATSPTPNLEVTPRRFRTNMSDEWVKEWNEKEREATERREAAEMKKKNELAIARQVVIRLWRQVFMHKHSIAM